MAWVVSGQEAFISGSWFWRTLRGHTQWEPASALVGSVAHGPLTRGDGLGVPVDQILAHLQSGALR